MSTFPTMREINGLQELLDELTSITNTLNSKKPLTETDKQLLLITNCIYKIIDNLDDRIQTCEYDLSTLHNYGHF